MKQKKFKTLQVLSLVGMICMLLLSACGGTQEKAAPDTQPAQTETKPDAAAAQQPVIIDNMGEKLEFTAPPKHAVTVNQHATEVMLALGLQSSMVGTAYLDDKILPEYQQAYDSIPMLSREYPSLEVILSKDVDFVYAGWKSAFTEKTLGLRPDLAKQGIQTYVQESSNKTAPTTDDVYQDIMNIGRIFRVEDRAQALIDKMKKEMDEIQRSIGNVGQPLNVFVYDSGEDAPYTSANSYVTTLIKMAGGKNIFDDIDKSWTSVSWEEVVNRNPDVIVIMDYGDTTVEQKKELLLSRASLKDVTAIQNKRFVVLPLSAAAEGVRAPMALKTLASGFYPEKVRSAIN